MEGECSIVVSAMDRVAFACMLLLFLRWTLSTFLSATIDGHVFSVTLLLSADAPGLLMA
jgi:hypothetical protein